MIGIRADRVPISFLKLHLCDHVSRCPQDCQNSPGLVYVLIALVLECIKINCYLNQVFSTIAKNLATYPRMYTNLLR